MSQAQAKKWKISHSTFEMKLAIFLVLFTVVSFAFIVRGADLVCHMGEFACKVNCLASGHTHGGCDENGDCACTDADGPSKWVNPINRSTL